MCCPVLRVGARGWTAQYVCKGRGKGCLFLKQEKLNDDYDISDLKLEINEKQLSYDCDTLRVKFENGNKILEKYKDCFMLMDDTLDKIFTDKYKSFINEYEEEHEKIKWIRNIKKTGWKIL